jgi:hypothetical protein
MDLSAEEIDELNRRLDAEWDVDRVLHLTFGSGILAGLFLGWFHNPRWRWLSLVVGNFALWTAIMGWSPAKALLQRLGVRTRAQVESERYYLLFGHVPPGMR